MIHEYLCSKCGTVFMGDGNLTELHFVNPDTGEDCNGYGRLMGTWSPPTKEES